MYGFISSIISTVYSWLSERLYHELSWAYDFISWIVSLGRWDSIRKLSLNYLVGEKILEIGYGTGELLSKMDTEKYTVYGLEISNSMRSQARKKFGQQGKDIPCIGADARYLPLADSTIDTVISTFPSGYILKQNTWTEVSRVLKDPAVEKGTIGGRFIIVGVIVYLRIPARRKPSKQPTRQDQFLSLGEEFANSANLKLQVIYWPVGIFEVPVLIADKYGYN